MFSNSTPDFLLNNNKFSFFNNNANIPVPLTNNRLPYTNKFFNNNNNNNRDELNNSNNKIKNNNNNIDFDVPSLSPQINSVELFSLPSSSSQQSQPQPQPQPQSQSQSPQQQQQPKLIIETSVPQFPQYCSLKKCELCERGQPALLLKTPTWSSIMKVVFFTLHNEYPEKQYFSLKTEVYEFMTSHWEKLCINRKRTDNWRKQIQDMLSHSKNVFESGLEKLKQNGFWKLRNIVDPWVINEKSSSSSSNESSPIINGNQQWRKKRSFDDTDYSSYTSSPSLPSSTSSPIVNSENNNKKLKTPIFSPISSPSLSSLSSSAATVQQQQQELESIETMFGKEIQSIRNETKKLFQLLPTMKYDQTLTKETLSSIQIKLSEYESRLNFLEKEKESIRSSVTSLPFSPFPISNKLNFNINNNNFSEPSSPSQQIPSSPSQSTDISRSNSPIPLSQFHQNQKLNCNNTNSNNNNNNNNSQKLFFV